jgi:hypothetical protein
MYELCELLQEAAFVFVPQALLRRTNGRRFGHCCLSVVAVFKAYPIAAGAFLGFR